MKFLARNDEPETSKRYQRFYITLKTSVIADFQHQLYMESGNPVTEVATTKAIEELLRLYSEGRVAIVGNKATKRSTENAYLKDHINQDTKRRDI